MGLKLGPQDSFCLKSETWRGDKELVPSMASTVYVYIEWGKYIQELQGSHVSSQKLKERKGELRGEDRKG